MATNSKPFHEEFMRWASAHGGLFFDVGTNQEFRDIFERGGNENGRDTYVDPTVQMAWRLWQDVADGVVKPEPDKHQ